MLHRRRKAAQPRQGALNPRENAEKGVNMTAFASRPSPFEFQPVLLAAELRARLPQAPPQSGGEDDPDAGVAPPAPGATRAAVLIPLVAAAEPVLLFTRRTETLARHSGQVSFPGGRVEPCDASPLATALRETAEETGIAGTHVDPAGYLARHRTGTGFDIQPVVGVLRPGFVLRPDPGEVAAVFEAPLAFFADPANLKRASREWNGHVRSFYTFTYDGHEIWGATAAIIVDLVTRLGAIEGR
jgi:8-oxo-dGTP pyrophosphatase MutT (NUDIX family)